MKRKILAVILFIVMMSYTTSIWEEDFFPKIKVREIELIYKLTCNQYAVTQKKKQERPTKSKYLKHDEKGSYNCIVCEVPLFESQHKIKSSSYPTFTHTTQNVVPVEIYKRTGYNKKEARCDNCGSFLGNITKGRKKTIGRKVPIYEVMSVSLKFVPEDEISITQI